MKRRVTVGVSAVHVGPTPDQQPRRGSAGEPDVTGREGGGGSAAAPWQRRGTWRHEEGGRGGGAPDQQTRRGSAGEPGVTGIRGRGDEDIR